MHNQKKSILDMQESPQISFSMLLYRFQHKTGDAGARVPARELHTRPEYINTRILTDLILV